MEGDGIKKEGYGFNRGEKRRGERYWDRIRS